MSATFGEFSATARGKDIFYYVTAMNQNYEQPDLPPEMHEAVIKGIYSFARHRPDAAREYVHLLGSGAIRREVIAAADLLVAEWRIASDVWSVTSFSELARDARETSRYNRLHPLEAAHAGYLAGCLSEPFPIVAATDYVAAYPQLISSYVRQPFVALGTDGFGRSDTRCALRRFFEVDRHHIVVAALHALAQEGRIPSESVDAAINRYAIETQQPPPWMR